MFRTIFLISVSFLSACATTPEPYDGIKGYQLKTSDDELSVVYTDEVKRGRDHMLSLIAEVCSAQGTQAISPRNLTITSEKTTIRQIEIPVRIPNTTITSIGGMENHTATTHHDQNIFNTIKLREITARCSKS